MSTTFTTAEAFARKSITEALEVQRRSLNWDVRSILDTFSELKDYDDDQDEPIARKSITEALRRSLNLDTKTFLDAFNEINDDDDGKESDPSQDSDEFDDAETMEDDTTQSTGSSQTHRNALVAEHGLVTITKLIALCLILTASLIGILVTTYLVKTDENDLLNQHLQTYAAKVLTTSQDNIEKVIHAARSLSRSITQAANRPDTTGFPFLTVPSFEVLAAEARELSSARIILYAPLIASVEISAWESFARHNTGWIDEALRFEGRPGTELGEIPNVHTMWDVPENSDIEDVLRDLHVPVWQTSTAPQNISVVNLDLLTQSEIVKSDARDVILRRLPVLSSMQDLQDLMVHFDSVQVGRHPSEVSEASALAKRSIGAEKLNPISKYSYPLDTYLLHPVYHDVASYEKKGHEKANSSVAGMVMFILSWESLLADVASNSINGIAVVVDDGCGKKATYSIDGPKAHFLGRGDRHEIRYSEQKLVSSVIRGADGPYSRYIGTTSCQVEYQNCPKLMKLVDSYIRRPHVKWNQYTISIYPSTLIEGVYASQKHIIYASAIGVIIASTAILLLFYDCIVIRHQRKLIYVARQTTALISSLFPKEVQRRIIEERSGKELLKTKVLEEVLEDDDKAQLRNIVDAYEDVRSIADYFPSATIFFADIVGFTTWSSTRDPCQVFQLLETVYQEFDLIAKRRGVFKVETISECYMAATGLPEETSDHAVAMARFARHCMTKFGALAKDLETSLGPDTGDLALRIGINSGPVTAGVLRGERTRFQLFGDTVNTASRMETTALPGTIQLSKATADLLITAGKQRWLTARADKIQAKGKGELQTFWLEMGSMPSSEGISDTSADSADGDSAVDEDEAAPNENLDGNSAAKLFSDKTQRLIKWNSDVLTRSLKLVIAQRQNEGVFSDAMEDLCDFETRQKTAFRSTDLVLDEVVENVTFPLRSNGRVLSSTSINPDCIHLSTKVEAQILDFVRTIAAMHHDANPFHNFEHTSHVVMFTSKLLASTGHSSNGSDRHAHRTSVSNNGWKAYETNDRNRLTGVVLDPLAQFAALFSALIHDTDHPGVPNATLVRESSSLAVSYRGKSVAEQNSVDLAWDLFMDPKYEQLRRALYVNKAELVRFRQLVVNMVMATDICDKELGALRKKRWEMAFATDDFDFSSEDQYAINRKATIVLEHLIQASVLCHAMQDWNIYLKWNERFFQECWRAYQHGRLESDPSENWYKGEIDFFDYYVIPLARKLESCGVFGVWGVGYMACATKNRAEWISRGESYAQSYIDRHSL